MSKKATVVNSQTIFFVFIIFTLLLFLVAVIFIFSSFFKSVNGKDIGNSNYIYKEKDLNFKIIEDKGIVDYNFKT